MDNTNNWQEFENPGLLSVIDSGKYSIINQVDSAKILSTTHNLGVDFTQDFRLEIKLNKLALLSNNASFSFVWGGLDDTHVNQIFVRQVFEKLIVSDKIESKNINNFSESSSKNIIKTDFLLVLDKYNNQCRASINAENTIYFPCKKVYGNKLGFALKGKSNVEIDYIKTIQPEKGTWLEAKDFMFMEDVSFLSYSPKKRLKTGINNLNKKIILSSTLQKNNVITHKNKIVKLKRGLNYIQYTVKDAFGHEFSKTKIIRYRDSLVVKPEYVAIFFC